MRLALVFLGLSLSAMCGGAGGEPAANGRTVLVATVAGPVAVYLPAGHDPRKTWPVIAYLPSREEPAEESLAPWLKVADAVGLVVAVPAGGRPDPERGFSDLVVVSTVRGGLQGANGDPERTAIVGHGAGGVGASAVAVSYPRLVRFVVIVGAVPVPTRQVPMLVERTPARLVLAGTAESLEKAREWQKVRPEERTEVGEFKEAEKAFSRQAVKRAIDWLGLEGRLIFGGRPVAEVAAPEANPRACGAEMDEAGRLEQGGAFAGAYIRLLRGARLDPTSGSVRANLALACLAAGRREESVAWAREALRLGGGSAAAHLVAGSGLVRLGLPAEAVAELKLGGAVGVAAAAAVEKRRGDFKLRGVESAREQFRRAAESLAGGDFKAAAKAARAAVRAAPGEGSCRVLAAYAVFNAEGLAAARRELDDYLEMVPVDVQVAALGAALDATARTEYVREGREAEAEIAMGRMLAAGPGATLLTTLAAKAGLGAEDEKLAAELAGAGANRDLRAGLPVLVAKGVKVHVGLGTLDDLRQKLAGGVPVLVQMPQGELAGLRENERYASGIVRLAVGYSDRSKCVLLRDYGAAKAMAVPYGLFDRLWGCLDRWWLAVLPGDRQLPGASGALTELELAAGKALAGDFDGALRHLGPVGDSGIADYPVRQRLARGMVLWRLGRLDEARKDLAGLTGEAVEFALQASVVLASIEEQAGGPMPARQEKAMEHYRRGWRLDPGNEVVTLSLAMALIKRARPDDLTEARELLEDYLRIQPASLPVLMLRYSF